VLGSSKLSAPEWSQRRNTVGIAQAVEAQSSREKARIARERLHVPLGSGRCIFCCVDHGQSLAGKWSVVARPHARQEGLNHV